MSQEENNKELDPTKVVSEIKEEENSLLLPHDFDGIKELDNPAPRWLMYLLYFTIFFSAVYWVHYITFKQGPNQAEEYNMEMAAAKANLKQQENVVEIVALTDEASLAEGKKIYSEKACYSCHGQLGEGNAVGPNLTDAYWIHGADIKALVEVLTNGVPAKGMAPFKDQLTAQQIQQVASYVLSLQGTNPPNAKAPQGEKVM